jgi:capsular exopolysaccharide synthesis family protein
LLVLFLLDRFDDRANSFTDLQEMFDEPVLSQIPREKQADQNGKLSLLRPDDKRHAFREAFRNLRSSLLYMSSEGRHPRILLVTSAIPNEGKSVTAANLAITLAQAGGRALLVDADLRKGVQHDRFGLESTPGLCEVLNGQTEWKAVLRPTQEPNLFLLARGRTSSNPSELFLGPTMQNLLKEAAAEFDWVVLDSAPVMAADDVATLAPRAEGVIFVLRANHTSARVARAALDLLYQRNVKIFGLAFNAVRTDSSEYYYYKYKSYYADEDGGKK